MKTKPTRIIRSLAQVVWKSYKLIIASNRLLTSPLLPVESSGSNLVTALPTCPCYLLDTVSRCERPPVIVIMPSQSSLSANVPHVDHTALAKQSKSVSHQMICLVFSATLIINWVATESIMQWFNVVDNVTRFLWWLVKLFEFLGSRHRNNEVLMKFANKQHRNSNIVQINIAVIGVRRHSLNNLLLPHVLTVPSLH